MGAEHSSLIDDDTPPAMLSERSLSAVADYIKDGRCRQIVVMTGAGLSTAAGIPDFRSPNTGLYANLARLNLPFAEAVFDIGYFRKNPDPFYVLAKELYPGNYSPTVSHVFISLLAKKGLLRMLFTQNIDCLEREAGVPDDHIVEAHGSFATQRCIECKKPFPDDLMRDHVHKGVVPRCQDKACGGLVKPDIVFFGEALPAAFHENFTVPGQADLILVLGTSLTVQPFASLPDAGRDETPRVLFNMERVGSFGTRADDVLELGDCDTGVRKLAGLLGWRQELEAEWRRVVGNKEAERQLRSVREREVALEGEMEDLADRVGAGLKLDEDEDERSDAGGREDASSGSASDNPDATTTTIAQSRDVTQVTEPDTEHEQKADKGEDICSTKDEVDEKAKVGGIEAKAETPGGEAAASKPESAADTKEASTMARQDTKDGTKSASKESANKSTL